MLFEINKVTYIFQIAYLFFNYMSANLSGFLCH